MRRPTPPPSPCSAARSVPGRRGFTLTELFVVLAIIAIVLGIGVPAINAVVRDSNASLAEQSLRTGVEAARDVAIASGGQRDGAAVFLFEPNGAVRIVPAVWVGRVEDRRQADRNPVSQPLTGTGRENLVVRDVFVPAPGAEAIEMPGDWRVRGWAAAGMIDDEWYDSPHYGNEGYNTTDRIPKQRGQWVFPESGFYDRTLPATVNAQGLPYGSSPDPQATPRQSFMVRFEAGSGILKQTGEPAIFVDPNPALPEQERDEVFQGSIPAADRLDIEADGWRRIDRAESLERWARRMLAERNFVKNSDQDEPGDKLGKLRWIGNESMDTVLVRPVSRLALYDDRDLAAALRAAGASGSVIHPETGTIYQLRETGLASEPVRPWLTTAVRNLPANANYPGGAASIITGLINGDSDLNGLIEPADGEAFSRIFVISPYTGDFVEVIQ